MAIDVGKVAMIKITDIEVGDRFREEMGDIEGLESSMKQLGMAQPICVKETDSEFPFLLLGGARRLAVLINSGNEEIPARIYPSDISELEMRSIELAENFWRKDFESWEYDKLVAEIHSLQQSIYGEKVSTSPDAEGWGMKETGDLIGVSKMSISSAIKRNEAREAFPELFDGCKTQRDANKVLEKINEAAIKDALAKKIAEQKTNGSLRSLANSFVINDFFKGIKDVPDNYFHLVEIDPPYAIDLTKQKKKDGASKYMLDDYKEVVSKQDYPSFMFNTFQQCYRVMAEHSWLVCWFAPEPWFETIYNLLIKAGFETTRMCGIWTKGTSGQNMNPSIRLANAYEMFFYAWKGQPALAKPGSSNDFHCPPIPPSQKTHPTERPVELMRKIYETFTWQGARVLIPFLGSGNGLFAAYELGMTGIGFELTKAYKDSFIVKANARLS